MSREASHILDVKELIAQLRSTVEDARSLPMSASVVINRSEALDLIGQLEGGLPTSPAAAESAESAPGPVVDDANHQAEGIIAEANRERDRLISETEVFRVAKIAAAKQRDEALHESEALRKDTDEYVDSRLANFEVTLQKTLEAVTRGRKRLQGRSDFHQLAADPEGATEEDGQPHNGAAESGAAMGQLRARD
ncbi:MAG: hypothetical protein ACR2KG_04785 [Nocardioidaceae bacterium]